MLSTGVIILLLAVLGIWILIEVKRMRHKLFAIFLIVLILVTYLSVSNIIKKNDIDIKTADGFAKTTKIYFSWLGSAFLNMKSITTNAVKMDWSEGQNSTKNSGQT